MHATLQILDRHRDTLNNHKIHWFDSPEQSDLIKPHDQQYNLNWSSNNQLSIDDLSITTAELNILFFPKSKERLDWWLAKISSQLAENQQLWVVGENNSGIKSIEKRIGRYFDSFKIDSARHCALVELRLKQPLEQSSSDWQSYEVKLEAINEQTNKEADETATDAQSANKIYSLPGVFSAAKLDKGSDLLIQHLPKLRGKVLEFGCGAGVLSLAIARQPSVSGLVVTDIDALAIHSTQKTLTANALQDKATLHWSDGLHNLPQQQFDAIVTNPPFHQGIKTAYAASEHFFSQAHLWLKPGGQLIWVVNDFLRYEPCLDAQFDTTVELTRQRGFKVLSATKKAKR
ncbi:class I SAM-dependent methyltransferase [Reinekea thalattae]|uniref:Class I SAM-dependent methyltransferase n=1 Tax=Reinekea thalattae TaxID=2593301 RepID=A0A5C8Z6Q9_9GAMM|nr:class I SAM-dependent methyltransferase [Reinekea thalattae]TXR53785.1 class I SAM-dependent methyltransferase [Reinekea thalattae]